MRNKEEENREPGEIVLSQVQKKALFHILSSWFVGRTEYEITGRLNPELVAENDQLRSLMKSLSRDLKIDIENYAPTQTLLFMGLSDCLADEKLQKIAGFKIDPRDNPHDQGWDKLHKQAAEYFLERRKGH